MKKIELIYDSECPHVGAARSHLQQALEHNNLPLQWVEWDRNDSASPDYARQYGSPTILIDGKDVAGLPAATEHNCCRIYHEEESLQGAPGIKTIELALQ